MSYLQPLNQEILPSCKSYGKQVKTQGRVGGSGKLSAFPTLLCISATSVFCRHEYCMIMHIHNGDVTQREVCSTRKGVWCCSPALSPECRMLKYQCKKYQCDACYVTHSSDSLRRYCNSPAVFHSLKSFFLISLHIRVYQCVVYCPPTHICTIE